MKSLKIITPCIVCISSLFFASCTYPTYVTEVHTVTPKPTPKKTVYKPNPKPVETAEGFRAVEKPTTYSN